MRMRMALVALDSTYNEIMRKHEAVTGAAGRGKCRPKSSIDAGLRSTRHLPTLLATTNERRCNVHVLWRRQCSGQRNRHRHSHILRPADGVDHLITTLPCKPILSLPDTCSAELNISARACVSALAAGFDTTIVACESNALLPSSAIYVAICQSSPLCDTKRR